LLGEEPAAPRFKVAPQSRLLRQRQRVELADDPRQLDALAVALHRDALPDQLPLKEYFVLRLVATAAAHAYVGDDDADGDIRAGADRREVFALLLGDQWHCGFSDVEGTGTRSRSCSSSSTT